MAYILADNIISPLGFTSDENYRMVKANESGLRKYAAGNRHIPFPFVASLLSDEQLSALPSAEGLSRFERLALNSAGRAVGASGIEVNTPRVVFILSSTKGSVEEMTHADDPYPFLGDSAKRIAQTLGITTDPIVVCNACISGLSALILATRLLQTEYDYAVVCGADAPSRFIISGFQSLKALSSEPCRPFDMDRFGLNIGEAAATLVLSREPKAENSWHLDNGYVKNDAFHISAPSKKGEGLYRALQCTLDGVRIEDLALVNAHGTATLFNDQMESVALERAHLTMVPTNALKGYFGHTLGAAGLLETIISMKAADDHTLLGTRGFSELGVSGKLCISADHQPTDKLGFIKILSGFGGCNASLLASKKEEKREGTTTNMVDELLITHRVYLSPTNISVDGNPVSLSEGETGRDRITLLYKNFVGDYPKYYKMDALSRLGFVASELLLQAENRQRFERSGDRAILFCNHSSSLHADKLFLQSMGEGDDYFPSPSVFVYTLPNIVTGEIAIRNGYQGETSFFILPEKNDQRIMELVRMAFVDQQTMSVLGGWLDYEDECHYEADLFIAQRKRK